MNFGTVPEFLLDVRHVLQFSAGDMPIAKCRHHCPGYDRISPHFFANLTHFPVVGFKMLLACSGRLSRLGLN